MVRYGCWEITLLKVLLAEKMNTEYNHIIQQYINPGVETPYKELQG